MNSEFRFWMPAHIRCGQGAALNMLDEIQGESVLIISDPFLYQNGTAERIGNALTGKTVVYFSQIEPNPSTTSVDACAALARKAGAQTIVGLGGGSSLDVAKVVACLTTNEGSIYDYYAGGTKKFAPRTTRLILIPTTAGTGSEVTNVGVFTDPRKGIKMPFVCGEFWADVALIDPEMTYTLPKGQTASTGMDAFCHAIEAYWNRESQPMCDYLAMGAMKSILENIRTAYAEPENAEARAAMIVSALTAGVAFSQTRTTGVHAVSFPLTTEFHANHGTACAITLPAFIRISTEMAADKMQALAQFLGYADVTALADGIEQLMADMGMPVRLSQLGVTDADIEHIAAVGMGAAAQMQLTPATMTQETLCRLLRTIL